jgi:hypothetical protein
MCCSSVTSHETSAVYLLQPFKQHQADKRPATDADVKQAATSLLQTLGSDFFLIGIQALVPMWERCVNVTGDYVEFW